MRYRDLVPDQTTTYKERLRTATLYVLDDAEWAILANIQSAMKPSRIVGVRLLAPRFCGFSVDVLCSDIDAAWELFCRWHDHSVDKLSHTVEQAQRETRPQG